MTNPSQAPHVKSYQRTLPEAECFELLAVATVGRIGFVSPAGVQTALSLGTRLTNQFRYLLDMTIFVGLGVPGRGDLRRCEGLGSRLGR